MKPITIAALALSFVATGCSSSVRTADLPTMSCIQLDTAVSQTAREIASAAITRERTESFQPPRWLLGATRTQEALVERQTRKLDEARALQETVLAERRRRCG